MSFRERIQRYREDMKRRGVPSIAAAPPFHRLLWAMGIEVKPPVYQSGWAIALAQAGYLVLTVVVAWWAIEKALQRPIYTSWVHYVLVPLPAIIIGCWLTVRSYRKTVREHGVPDWSQY
jgi:hypothetical protein